MPSRPIRQLAQRLVRPSVVTLLLLSACGSDTNSSSASTTAVTDVTDVVQTVASTATQPAAAQPAATGASVDTTPATDRVTTTSAEAPTTTAPAKGWAIHDALASQQSGAITMYDAVSCESEMGPWHIVSSFVADGNVTQNVFYDATLSADGTGTLTGEEHSTWSDGLQVDGTFTGTSSLTTAVGDGLFDLVIDYDASATFINPSGPPDAQTDHLTKALTIIAATPAECA